MNIKPSLDPGVKIEIKQVFYLSKVNLNLQPFKYHLSRKLNFGITVQRRYNDRGYKEYSVIINTFTELTNYYCCFRAYSL